MSKLGGIDWLALVLIIIGGLNWGLIGAFKFDLVNAVLGSMPTLVRIIYILVGLSALYAFKTVSKVSKA